MRFPFDSEYVDYRQVLDDFIRIHGKLATVKRGAYYDANGVSVSATSFEARYVPQTVQEGTQRDFQFAGLSNLGNEDGRDSLWFRYDALIKEGDLLETDGFTYRVTLAKPLIHRDMQGLDKRIALQVNRTREGIL